MPLRFFCILVVLSFSIPSIANGKDYSVPRVVIFANIHDDGTITYQEHRTYAFDGSFSEADYILPRRGYDEIRDIDVREHGRLYRLSDSGDAGTYRVRQTSDNVEITWNYDARDEERTFIISYTLVGAIVRGREHSEFFWVYLSDRWERGTDELEVNIHFDTAGEPSEFYHFLRGATDLASVEVRSHGYRITGGPFTTEHTLAMQAIFPSSLIPDAPVTDPEYTREMGIAEAERLVQEAEAREARQVRLEGIFRSLSLLVALLSVFLFVVLYARFSRDRPNLRTVIPDRLYTIPGSEPPALAAILLQGAMAISTHHLVATLFDLSRRGYFRIIQDKTPKRRFKKSSTIYRIENGESERDDLRPWEADLAYMIREQIEAGEDRLTKIFDFSKHARNKWYTSWTKALKADLTDLSIWNPSRRNATVLNFVLQVPILIFAIPAIRYAGWMGFLPLLVAVLAMICTGLLHHRTDEGEELVQKWSAYRRALKSENYQALTGSLDAHFTYAVAFGLSGRTEAFVSHAVTDDFVWFYSIDGAILSPHLLTQAITNMTSSVSSTVATGAGATAGMAGGGAGGGAR